MPILKSRRSVLQTAFQIAAAAVVRPSDHGRIKPPRLVPNIAVVAQDGTRTTLPKLLKGHVTALQLMFTQCETTCPMQGAIFERVQKSIPDMMQRKLQLFSLSIEPDNDTPAAMQTWLHRFHAGDGWIAAAAIKNDLARAREFFGQGRSVLDDHSTQIQIVSHEAELIWRTNELPSAEEITGILLRATPPSQKL